MAEQAPLRFPVVTAGSEYLVMGQLMRRNILAYKAPMNNEGYDLICIHPDPRHKPAPHELAQVRVQGKSRYATDCDWGFPIKKVSINAFDFLIIVFLNIGKFKAPHNGTTGQQEIEFYTLPGSFIREHHTIAGGWEKVMLRGLDAEIQAYKGEAGFELIAQAMGIARPSRQPGARIDEEEEEPAEL